MSRKNIQKEKKRKEKKKKNKTNKKKKKKEIKKTNKSCRFGKFPNSEGSIPVNEFVLRKLYINILYIRYYIDVK